MSAPDPQRLAAAPGAGRIEDLRRLPGGASRETWHLKADDTPLVLRRDAGGRPQTLPHPTEAALLHAASAGGVPVPAVRASLDDGYVMDFVEGETIPRRILRDERYASVRPRMAEQCGEILARIHALPPTALPPLPSPPPGEEPARWQLAVYRDLLDSLGEAHPAFEIGLRWLGESAPPPPPGEPRLVHGDFRNGNFVVGADGIRAVLDWELAHLGDPLEDLGWLCVKSWRFGQNDKPVGGFGARDDLFAAYERAGGIEADPDAVRWWEIFGTMKWGIICVLQASLHLRGLQRSVELATLGRRVGECEWDLLEAIG